VHELLARTLRGIEWIAAAEIHATLGVSKLVHGHRELRFSLPQLTPDLLALGTIDDVFLIAAVVTGSAAVATAARLAAAATAIDLDALAEVRPQGARSQLRRGRQLPGQAEFQPPRAGGRRRGGNRGGRRLGLPRALGRRSSPKKPLASRLDDTRTTFAVRIAAAPLHRRTYCTASRPGSPPRPSREPWPCSQVFAPGWAWWIRSAEPARFRSRRSSPARGSARPAFT
jgi:hypothetical protein